jgi:uncharacterized protein
MVTPIRGCATMRWCSSDCNLGAYGVRYLFVICGFSSAEAATLVRYAKAKRQRDGFQIEIDKDKTPGAELPPKTRTFARMMVSLTEEAEAINWYEQRMALEKDKNAHAIMANAQKEEFKHFSMDLEWLLRAKPIWREIAQGVLFTEGDIVKRGERAEEKA